MPSPDSNHLCAVLRSRDTGGDFRQGERATWRVIWLTAAMMAAEIAAGWAFNSMALLADGWHMASHVGALGITAFAYAFARRHAENPCFAFGTGKVGALGGFASAVALAMVALFMVWESLQRMLHPLPIAYGNALLVAVLGLAVNLASAWLLGHGHEHHGHAHEHGGHDHHDHEQDSDRHHHRHDLNLRAAYLHVLADALTSVTAIAALLLGKAYGWAFMDPLMGVAGSAVIARWAWGLLGDTGRMLLDHTRDDSLGRRIIRTLEAEPGTAVTDLHLWRVGPRHLSLMVAVHSRQALPPDHFKALLNGIPDLFHVLVEVNPAHSAQGGSAAGR